MLRADGKTKQPNHSDLEYWATGVSATYLVGALERALHPEPHHVPASPAAELPSFSAELLPIVVTPLRFQSKRGFWAYCGLGIVQRSSSDWVRAANGEWARAQVRQTRGLNRQFNHTLKAIFKGAATTVIGRGGDEPINRHYVRLLEGGTKRG